MMSDVQINRRRYAGILELREGLIITLYMTLKPFYLFSSGLPQISDMFLFAATIVLLLRERGKLRIPGKYTLWIMIFIGTLVFQTFVQAVWWTKTKENNMMLYAAYYVFNFIASVLCIYIGSRIGVEKLKRSLCLGCFLSIIVTAIGIATQSRYHGIRSTGFFNNPNQLGYYALLILTIIALFPKTLPKWQTAIILAVAIWANIVSLSKASIVGIAGLAVCYTIWGSKNKTMRRIVTEVLLLLFLFGSIYWLLFSNSSFVSNSETLSFLRRRLLRITAENDSSLATGRGYDRVWELSYHFFWGKGEGAYDRFKVMPGYEIHATFINTFVSYGLIGLAAFLYLMLRPLIRRGETVRNLACFSGLFLYFFTHNGLRNTLLWILIAVVLQISLSWDIVDE